MTSQLMLMLLAATLQHHQASALAMAAQCTSLESDFDQSLASCFGLLSSGIPRDTIASTVESKTDGLVAEMELSLHSADQMTRLCSKLTAFKDCQDGILNNSSQNWSGCPWWAQKVNNYVYKLNGYHDIVCKNDEYKKNWFCAGQMLSSYLAERCNKMMSQRNRLAQASSCQLSNEYLGCLSALISSGCGTAADQLFQPVAARMLGQRDCQGRYNFVWPEYAFKFDSSCSSNFQTQVRTNEDLFRVRTDFMMTGALPIVRSGRKFGLQKDLCDAVHDYENGLDSINHVCPRGYNLLRALFEWKPRFYQMKFICLNLNDYTDSHECMQTASLSQCDQHTNEARGLLFHRLEMQCTDYSRRRIQDLQAAWDAANRCLETAMSRQCGARAGQLFGALVRMRNTLQRFEIDCQGAYVSNNYTVEQFLIRPEAAAPRSTIAKTEYVADEGGSSGWQQQQQQQTKGQSRDRSSKANGRRASPKSVAAAAIAAAVATFLLG
ncbi:hypothetical protein BOX15_Mlig027548g2 [Macrostomum lignano]|uniref:Secreted protein n=1 Tax=Macrostomum lignano TaxID=282301 RepID=A0A267E939_9PLAT|nr:hypothetical protein BOX15_Mlig027548g2 [Macrostomum lignano]